MPYLSQISIQAKISLLPIKYELDHLNKAQKYAILQLRHLPLTATATLICAPLSMPDRSYQADLVPYRSNSPLKSTTTELGPIHLRPLPQTLTTTELPIRTRPESRAPVSYLALNTALLSHTILAKLSA